MARRRRREEVENHERWLVSYADFITLLFAFFVVMYAISSVNEGKYRVLSQTLNQAFHDPSRSLEPIQIGEPVIKGESIMDNALGDSVLQPDPAPSMTGAADGDLTDPDSGADESAAGADASDQLSVIAQQIRSALQPLIDRGLVDVNSNAYWVEVDMKSRMLFESGSARTSREALRALRRVTGILSGIPNPVHVEGYTDNIPINTRVFPSNWELSAARAASVVHVFTNLGMDPARLAAVGYGAHRPVASNATEQGRQNNRRVAVVVMAMDAENKAHRLRPEDRSIKQESTAEPEASPEP